MTKKPHPDSQSDRILLQFMLRAQQDARLDKGYAMVMTSIVSIVLFSMLAAYMTVTNLSKSSTNAFVDGNNTFYAAESGLNKRAQELRERFSVSILPSAGSSTAPSSISDCFSIVMTDTQKSTTYNSNNDFECRNYRFQSGNSSATLKSSGAGSTEVTNKNDPINYITYTFVKPKQNYAVTAPTPQRIATGQPFAGLNALEYKYTVSATAKKLNLATADLTSDESAAKSREASGTTMAGDTALIASANTKQAQADARNATLGTDNDNHKTVLQMDFKSRVIPLFQFAAFYEDDLEMDSQMPMTISGPIHTNGNLRAAAYGFERANDTGSTYVPSLLKASFNATDLLYATKLLDKVTVTGRIYDRVAATQNGWRPSICTSDGNGSGQHTNCGVMAVYKGSGDKTLPANYYFFPDATSGRTMPLTSIELADFGDRMQDSSTISRLNPPQPGFLRETNYKTTDTGQYYGKADIRLKFYPNRAMPFDLTSIKSGSGCNLTTNKISTDRQGAAALSCTALTKGQLRSLQQPVVTKSTSTLNTQDENVLKALRVAIAASGTIVPLSKVNQTTTSFDALKSSTVWVQTFETLLKSISGLDDTDATTTQARNNLLAKTPKQLVENLGSKFLAAPIQAVGTRNTTPTAPAPAPSPAPSYTTADANGNVDFCNSLKSPGQSTATCTQMKLLQINIQSLTYWNRDGIYVEADAANKGSMTSDYAAPTTISIGLGLSTDNLAFIKATADASKPDSSFAYNGLAAADRTESGLVLYANVSDIDANIVATSSSNNGSVPGKDASGNPIAEVDYYRKYDGSSTKRNSPYGFVFSGGEELPGPLTIATDQAAYVQGDYNNPDYPGGAGNIPKGSLYTPSDIDSGNRNSPNPGFHRQPASIIADTITVLSNQCSNDNKQVNCGILNGTATSNTGVSNGIAINAAFLSNLIKSGSTQSTYNGGLNKYMRLLENWSGSTGTTVDRTYYNYTGSMVSLGEPLESDKLADGSGVPNRNFNYESRFNSFDKLPPLSPSAVYLQQDVFKRSYN